VTAPNLAAAENRPVSMPLAGRVDPKAFGLQDDTVTTISAWSFSRGAQPEPNFGNTDCPRLSPGLGRYTCLPGYDLQYYATLDLPAGAVIDLIGVSTATDADAIMGFGLWKRNRDGSKELLSGFSFPAHGWATDYAAPAILIDSHLDREYLLEVEQAPSPNFEYFGWVEIWWHRSVSPPPASPTFGDVPTTDLGYSYVEAMAASKITGGCGGGNFCPDANLTRRQMAIFLAKALGLHWPN
jgi:S-layer homology domain